MITILYLQLALFAEAYQLGFVNWYLIFQQFY